MAEAKNAAKTGAVTEITKGCIAMNFHHITPHSTVIRVLIADRQFLLAALLGRILNSSGFETEHAPDLDETLTAIRLRGPFDIVLLDIDIPGMFRKECVADVISANAGG